MAQVINLPTPRGHSGAPTVEPLDSAGTPLDPGPINERVDRSALAVDEAAASTEDLIRLARGLRADLMAGHDPDMQVALLAMTTRLAGIANVLGETHTELDEISNETNGGGAA